MLKGRQLAGSDGEGAKRPPAKRCEQLGGKGGPPLPAPQRARATAEAVLTRLRNAARLHWRRVEGDVRLLATAYPSSWFRGRDPALKLEDFREEWSMGGRFCEADLAPVPAMRVSVTRTHPVPMP